jgi:hypothetical protein
MLRDAAKTPLLSMRPVVVMAGLVPAIHVFRYAAATAVRSLSRLRGWVGVGALSQDPTMIEVTKLKYLDGYRLHATFSDGTSGEHDFSALVAQSGPMIESLRDPGYFARVFLEYGAPTWPNGFDMCPDWLHQKVEAAGTLERDESGLLTREPRL